MTLKGRRRFDTTVFESQTMKSDVPREEVEVMHRILDVQLALRVHPFTQHSCKYSNITKNGAWISNIFLHCTIVLGLCHGSGKCNLEDPKSRHGETPAPMETRHHMKKIKK